LQWLGSRIRLGVGIDYQWSPSPNGVSVILADITGGLPVRGSQFEHVVMLAVLEHLAEPDEVLREAHRILMPGGSLIMTWPHPIVDVILEPLHRIGLVSEDMESEKHQDRIPVSRLQDMLKGIGFEHFVHRRFEFGLNNLIVAVKSVGVDPAQKTLTVD
jgi:ubiquinone/menaquinone biosynthesis C-methylase UbiE